MFADFVEFTYHDSVETFNRLTITNIRLYPNQPPLRGGNAEAMPKDSVCIITSAGGDSNYFTYIFPTEARARQVFDLLKTGELTGEVIVDAPVAVAETPAPTLPAQGRPYAGTALQEAVDAVGLRNVNRFINWEATRAPITNF